MPEHQEIGQRDFSTLQTRNLHRKAIFNMTCINDKYEDLWKCLEPWNMTCINAPALDMKITELVPMIISETRQLIDSMEKGEGFDHKIISVLPHQPTTGMPKRQRAGRRHQNRKENRAQKKAKTSNVEAGPEDAEVSDDDTWEQISLPRRSAILRKLSDSLRTALANNGLTSITHDAAKDCLGEARYDLMKQTEMRDDKLTLTDSNGKMHLLWATKSLHSELLPDSTMIFDVAGNIRDQFNHPLCWDFTLCDMVSITAVLRGQMKEYQPLSHMYLCQHVDPKNYRAKDTEEGVHWCYPMEFFHGLSFVYSKGIPIATSKELEKDFMCSLARPLGRFEKKYHITDAFRYPTLEEALIRLKTHPVAATLTLFGDWEAVGIYKGPVGLSTNYAGEHEVLMIDLIEIKGEKAIRCKASNGLDTGNEGYLYVSPEVMLMEVGSSGKKNSAFCLKKPRHLLYDFYSIDMAKGKYEAKVEDIDPENKKYRINFGIDPKSKSPTTGICSRRYVSRKPEHLPQDGVMRDFSILQHELEEDTLRTGVSGDGKDMPPGELQRESAIYIAATHLLKPSYSVLKPEPREMERNLSEAMNTNVEKKTVKVNITEIVSVTPGADHTLPLVPVSALIPFMAQFS